MLFRLSRVSFWLAALVAALALLAPDRHATLLTGMALVASAMAYGFWRSALRTQYRDHAALSAVPEPVELPDATLREATAAVMRAAADAPTLEAALHAVARTLRGELGARQCTVWELYEIDATHARLGELIESQPGFHAVATRVRLAGTALARAIDTQQTAGRPPDAVVLPVCAGERVVALIEWAGIAVPVSAEVLDALFEQARRGLSARTATLDVLLVEDNVVQTESASRRLQRLGCRVTAASGMLHAVQALGRTQFDLVLVDLSLAGTEAAAVLRQLRAASAGTVAVPVIAITEPGHAGDAQRIRESGFDDHASKPLDQGQMLSLLNRHLRLSAPADSHGSTAPGAVSSGAVPDVLDPAALARLAELDPKGENHLLQRVLQAFQTSAARLRPQAEAAREKGDRAGVRLVVHTLKSSSASIGATHLSQLCAQIETTIRLESGEDLDALLDAFNAALDDVLRATARLIEERA